MIKRSALLFAAVAAAAALAVPATAPAESGPPTICYYVPDLDGHVWGPYCFTIGKP